MPKLQKPKPQPASRNANVPQRSAPPKADRPRAAADLIELRPGLYVNPLQFISVRVLPREDGQVFALLALSNGEKLDLTRSEFAVITGVEPGRSAVAVNQELKGSVKPTRIATKTRKT